jgi:hypothetical protein
LREPGVSIQGAFLGLVDNHLTEERINTQALQERAEAIMSEIKERLPTLLGHRFNKAKETIQTVEAEEEELATRLLDEAPHLLEAYQNAGDSAAQTLSFVANCTLRRLLSDFPSDFMDGKLFDQPYSDLNIGGDAMRERLRKNSLEKVNAYLSDVIILLQAGRNQGKQELLRYANTLNLLEGLLQ